MKLIIGSDHAGFSLKEILIKSSLPVEWIDVGTYENHSVDYPDYANKVCERLLQPGNKDSSLGILICGSGQGMAMAANKRANIRAALCWNKEMVELSRQHNNANILCLGARVLSEQQALEMVQVFIESSFEGGRHQRRIEKFSVSS